MLPVTADYNPSWLYTNQLLARVSGDWADNVSNQIWSKLSNSVSFVQEAQKLNCASLHVDACRIGWGPYFMVDQKSCMAFVPNLPLHQFNPGARKPPLQPNVRSTWSHARHLRGATALASSLAQVKCVCSMIELHGTRWLTTNLPLHSL